MLVRPSFQSFAFACRDFFSHFIEQITYPPYSPLTTHRDDCIPQEWDGLELPSGSRVEPRQVQTDLAKVPRLREDFDDVRSILTLVYYSRPSNGTFLYKAAEEMMCRTKCFPCVIMASR